MGVLFASAVLALAPSVSADERHDEGAELFASLCSDCHAGRSAEAGYDVVALLEQRPIAASLFDVRRGRAMVATGAMPPDFELTAEERAGLAAYFEHVEREAHEQGGGAGVEPVRRLTRTELRGTLRELLGVDLELDALLPAELVADDGFEASSATLFVHAQWIDRASAAVRIAVDRAALDPTTFDLPAFLRRAFRRPPTADELERYRADLVDADTATLRATVAAICMSPNVLLRVEDATNDTAPDADGERPVGQFGLASRLSFLLWAAPPDDELLDLAAAGRLSDGRVLEAQARRLIEDPRGLEFARVFAGQWFGTHHLGTRVKPDPIDNPFMTDSLMAAMREEVARFVHHLFRDERPLDDLLTSRATFVDRELAQHYRIDTDALPSEGFARVELIDSRRRGVLGKAGVLMVTSHPDRTSPVVRGAWILDELLGTPPPPPPPGASEFDDALFEDGEFEGTRGMLELHRQPTSCASCHATIDPLGFALEGFDRFGRTRAHDDEGFAVDTSGVLPGGIEFRGPTGLSRALVEHRRGDLAREASRRLLSYALARPLTWRDERTVTELAATLEADGFGALLRGVLASRPFLRVEVQ